MSIREIARQAAQDTHQRECWNENPEVTTIDLVADAVAAAVLQFAKNRIGTDYDPEFEINLMLAAFTPAEPPPQETEPLCQRRKGNA